jgi:hypothetical protein
MPTKIEQPIDIATRAKLRAREHFQQNRFVTIGAGALVVALLIFVATSIPRRSTVQKTKVVTSALKEEPMQNGNAVVDRSSFPLPIQGRPRQRRDTKDF